jgi:DNA (cytosine-5)-methyltransferase 1
MNVKALDFIKPILEGLKPRILVLENTANLVNMEKNRKHFHRLLRNITTAKPGYSIIYKVINMVDYGLPQPRKRLIIIAARYEENPNSLCIQC